ncbi:MAG TPA: trehalose-6-phosphate synthase [Steroidobacteraceae bacterium]|nr:trehalose-6-phosphate synthase [Steroidobacteraceae bacterium]
MKRLVCVSNRIAIPRRATPPGGLAVGVLAALQRVGGLWFGWSGETAEEPRGEPEILVRENVVYATVDLRAADLERYYSGFCNSALWPLFHYAVGRFRYENEDYEAYQAVNSEFAAQLSKLLRADDVVWVHDYHLIPLGRALREHGFRGPVGFFLHIPFPPLQILRVLPSYGELVRDLCEYDLVGFQTEDDLRAFESCLDQPTYSLSRTATGSLAQVGGRNVKLGVYPIGVDADQVAREGTVAAREETVRRLTESLLGRKLIIGVDRLDYTKGLTQRFAAFEHFLAAFPDSHGKVTFLQIAPLSRADVLAYSEIRMALEQTAGRLNGRFAEADWTPLRYLNRNFSHATLMGLLRASQVALVTPVRDGMNLVAKEYVAAQDPHDPGVLILSPLAGAARELTGALLVNPYDKRGTAHALQTALHMPLVERRQRHEQMLGAVRRHDIHNWYREFVSDLAGERLLDTRAAAPPLAASPARKAGGRT